MFMLLRVDGAVSDPRTATPQASLALRHCLGSDALPWCLAHAATAVLARS